MSQLTTWETCKENIQPLAQGRKIEPLFHSLSLVESCTIQEFVKTRKEQFEADLANSSEDAGKQFDIWCEYIDWLEQHLPDGGKVNGIAEVIEQCLENYYDKKEFKQDTRLFDIFMKYRRYCDEPIEIFGFMYANSISSLIAKFYLNWSWHYEMKKNFKRAEDLIKLGLKNLATPREPLIEAQAQLKCRIERMILAGDFGEATSWQAAAGQSSAAGRTFQSLKVRAKVPAKRIGSVVDTKLSGLKSAQTKRSNSNQPVAIFVDGATADSAAPASSSRLPTIGENPVPTSQCIKLVGRIGSQNEAPRLALQARPAAAPTTTTAAEAVAQATRPPTARPLAARPLAPKPLATRPAVPRV